MLFNNSTIFIKLLYPSNVTSPRTEYNKLPASITIFFLYFDMLLQNLTKLEVFIYCFSLFKVELITSSENL